MADKNVRLKSGNDVLYPQTKVGNILNDDGTKWEVPSGGGSDLYFDLSPFMETMQLDAEALEKFQNDITEGKIIGVTLIGTGLLYNYKGIYTNNMEISFYFSNGSEAVLISNIGAISTGNSLDIPFLPTDASSKTYTLKAVNGVLTWVE